MAEDAEECVIQAEQDDGYLCAVLEKDPQGIWWVRHLDPATKGAAVALIQKQPGTYRLIRVPK